MQSLRPSRPLYFVDLRLPLTGSPPPRIGLGFLANFGVSHSQVVHELWVLVVAGSNPATPIGPRAGAQRNVTLAREERP